MGGDRHGEGLGDVPGGAVIGERLVAAGQFDLRRQCPRANHLQLERAGPILGRLLDGVEVLIQPGRRATLI
jgi:hypothetical protein